MGESVRQWVTTGKQHVSDTTRQVYLQIHSWCENMHKTLGNSSQTKLQHGGKWKARSPVPRQEATELPGEGELVFFKGIDPDTLTMIQWKATQLRVYGWCEKSSLTSLASYSSSQFLSLRNILECANLGSLTRFSSLFL